MDNEICDTEIFQKGESIVLLDGGSLDVEIWVQEVAKKANARIDWHYSGGVAQVLHLGDIESRKRVEEAILNMPKYKNPRVMRVVTVGEPGLYRKNVTEAPAGALCGFIDPVSGKQEYITEEEE